MMPATNVFYLFSSLLGLLYIIGTLHFLPAKNRDMIQQNAEELWSNVEVDLDRAESHASYQFIIDSIRNHCEKDITCLHDTYYYDE